MKTDVWSIGDLLPDGLNHGGRAVPEMLDESSSVAIPTGLNLRFSRYGFEKLPHEQLAAIDGRLRSALLSRLQTAAPVVQTRKLNDAIVGVVAEIGQVDEKLAEQERQLDQALATGEEPGRIETNLAKLNTHREALVNRAGRLKAQLAEPGQRQLELLRQNHAANLDVVQAEKVLNELAFRLKNVENNLELEEKHARLTGAHRETVIEELDEQRTKLLAMTAKREAALAELKGRVKTLAAQLEGADGPTTVTLDVLRAVTVEMHQELETQRQAALDELAALAGPALDSLAKTLISLDRLALAKKRLLFGANPREQAENLLRQLGLVADPPELPTSAAELAEA